MQTGSEKKSPLFERFASVLIIISIGLAFLVGILWQKVSNLEKPSGAAPKASGAIETLLTVENLKKYAKDLKLDTKSFNSCLDESKMAAKVAEESNYGQEVKVGGTPAFFVNGRFIGGSQPFEIFKEVIDKELEGKGSDNVKVYSKGLQDMVASLAFDPVSRKVEAGDAPYEGSSDAKVTIITFSDFECPFCARFYDQTMEQIRKEYIETGKVKFVFKQFPLISIHQHAQKAAEASLCAKEQGKFWEYHNKLFEIQAI